MNPELRQKLETIVGRANVVDGAVVRAQPPAWDTHQPCQASVVVLPASTGEVADVLALCYAARQPVVTYGGVTNLVQACATTDADIVLDLARMDAIEELDTTAQTLTAQSGLVLRDAQQAADDAGMFYPVDIGARDNCTLGGNVATNAGGTKVIRYGMTRDAVLGLEAVLADGTVLSSMNRYLKNNSGFDLKQLFIGSEGVLGVVTRVVMKLSPKPASHNVALLACDNYAQVLDVLSQARAGLGAALCGFEVMWDSFYAEVVKPQGRQPAPLEVGKRCYVLVEAMGSSPATDDELFSTTLESMFDSSSVADGVIAKSGQEREALWAIRHDVEWIVSGAQNFDVSLRVADIGEYVDKLTAAITTRLPQARVAAFGHLGDNNLHVSVLGKHDAGERDFIEEQVYGLLAPYRGAISAEHGIGLEKRRWLPVSRTANEIAAMRALKRALDPRNILNPGKVIG
jgi:FAD/FMN-containing dehydrogenase